MPDKSTSEIVPSERDPGFFRGLLNELKLVWRLLVDRRVNFLLKLLPVGSLVYLAFPDFLFGPIDDSVVIGVGVYLFIELCPTDIVEEHRAALRGQISPPAGGDTVESTVVVEGRAKDKDVGG